MRDQLMASSSSIGANVAEAGSAQSRADFVSKFEIALKEARETGFRLALLQRISPAQTELQKWLLQECYELTAVLVSSVKTIKASGIRTGKLEMRDQK
jgi:four helix bundle protein